MNLLSVIVLSACAQNPVPGDTKLLLVSEDWELQYGAQNYLHKRQAYGGDYVVDPQVENYVRSVGNRLTAHSDRKLPYEFHVINDSDPGTSLALAGGKIMISRGMLIELKNESELAALLGHEIAHGAAKHVAKEQIRNIALQLGDTAVSNLAKKNGMGEQARQLSLIGSRMINSQYSQAQELEADQFGLSYMAEAGYDLQGAVGWQRTMARLTNDQHLGQNRRIFTVHPSSDIRVAETIKTAKTLPPGGDMGEDRYRVAMARLFKTRKAYDHFDNAMKMLKNGDAGKALALVRVAIRIEPREAHFHSLIGDINLQQNKLPSAKRSFDMAISLNDKFYYYYLQRGKVSELQKNHRAAQTDYANSVRLLPTPAALFGLGRFAERAGKLPVAKRYYAMATQDKGNDATNARAALMRLDETKLLVRQGLTSSGTFAIELINQTSRNITEVQLGISGGPGTRQHVQTVRQSIPAGQRRIIDTGRALTQSQANQIKVVILKVDVVQ